ncbi:MAG: hypothetical protein JOZ62_13595 [Acidobacteriaceae bacterium]|nr:hypothetical protein [Acidobacteriaceae bacterium]
MFKYWLNRLRGKPTVRAFANRSTLVYREAGREIEIGGEGLVNNGFEIDLSTIVSWNDRPAEALSEAEKIRIANAVMRVAADQWNMRVTIRGGFR